MVFAALLTSSLITPALANDGPQPRLFAQASGSAVTLTIELHAAGEPGIGEALDLVRVEGASETTLESGVRREVADAEYETEYCKNWEVGTDSTGDDTGNQPVDCDATPELCEDCDGDGVNECKHGCVTWQGWTVQDLCVNAGEVDYELREEGTTFAARNTSVTVSDVGQDCDDVGEGGTTDADSGEPTDDGGCEGCATASSPRAGRLLLGLVMGLVGWLAFRRD